MTALYRGQRVTVIRIETHRAYIVWRKMIKRVNPAALQEVQP